MKGKKIKSFIILLLALTFIALPVKAEELLTTTSTDKNSVVDNVYLEADNDVSVTKTVFGSGLVAGNNVTIDGNFDGVLLGAGNSIKHTGVATFAAIAGNMIEIAGTYEKDVVIAGNIISVRSEAKFGRDAALFGSEVTLSGVIERNIYIYAERVNIENATIKGSAQIYAKKISFGETSKINGNLKTNIDNIDQKYVDGTITKVDLKEVEFNISFRSIVMSKIISYVSLLATFLVLFLLFPKLFERNNDVEFNFMKIVSLCGTGIIFLVFVPVASIIVMTTIVGLPISFIAIALYSIALYISSIYTGYYVGNYLWKNVFKKEDNPLLYTLIGITLLNILFLIPYLGILVSFISLLTGLGLIINAVKKK